MSNLLLTKEAILKEGWREIHHREYLKEDKNGRLLHLFNGNKEWDEDERYFTTIKIHNKREVLYEKFQPSKEEFLNTIKTFF